LSYGKEERGREGAKNWRLLLFATAKDKATAPAGGQRYNCEDKGAKNEITIRAKQRELCWWLLAAQAEASATEPLNRGPLRLLMFMSRLKPRPTTTASFIAVVTN
jgi:hypothetical protein